jgi:vitamin B12 transport system ATP-binding protein
VGEIVEMLKFNQIRVAGRLNGASGQVNGGEFVHVLGTNGSGKSSLLSAIAGLLPIEQGQVWLEQKKLQDYSLPQLAALRCLQEQQQNSAFALTVSEVLYFFSEDKGLPAELDEALELQQFMSKPLNQLSGGEARRVHIARTLLQVWPTIQQGRALVLLDEPNQGLDFKHQHLLFRLLRRLCHTGNVVIVNHHDLNLCQQYADKIWLMQAGQIVISISSLEQISNHDLAAIFSCSIQSAVDATGNKIFQTYLD